MDNQLVMQEDSELRQELLQRELFQSGVTCSFCHLNEETLHCDILMSQTRCPKHMCVACFEERRDHPCQCGSKYTDHYVRDGQIKSALKYGHRDEAEKHYNKELKIRKSEAFSNLDYDLVNLMAQIYMNPAPPPYKRISYISLEETVKKTLREKKREERSILNERSVKKKAFFIGREKAHHEETGIESCGYRRTYHKGLDLVWRSFMPNQPFGNLNESSQLKEGEAKAVQPSPQSADNGKSQYSKPELKPEVLTT